MSKSKVDAVDVQIGNRLRLRRTALGITQQDLSKILKISFQQVQKYEKGINRLGPKRLLEMSVALEIPVNYFFQDITGHDSNDDDRYYGLAEGSETNNLSTTTDTNKLIKCFLKISQPEIREQILNLVVALSLAEKKR